MPASPAMKSLNGLATGRETHSLRSTPLKQASAFSAAAVPQVRSRKRANGKAAGTRSRTSSEEQGRSVQSLMNGTGNAPDTAGEVVSTEVGNGYGVSTRSTLRGGSAGPQLILVRVVIVKRC